MRILLADDDADIRALVGIDLRLQAGRYRGMSRRVVAYVIAHDNAASAQRALPTLGGFRAVSVPGGDAPLGPAARATLRDGARRAAVTGAATRTNPRSSFDVRSGGVAARSSWPARDPDRPAPTGCPCGRGRAGGRPCARRWCWP